MGLRACSERWERKMSATKQSEGLEPRNENDRSEGEIRADGRERRIVAEGSVLRCESEGLGVFVAIGFFPHAVMETHAYCCLLCGATPNLTRITCTQA